jgi:hypothetical protein
MESDESLFSKKRDRNMNDTREEFFSSFPTWELEVYAK